MDGQTTREKYISPFSTRYASEEMQYLFSDTHKFRTWRRLWIALARAEHALGLPVTEEQVAELEAHRDDINFDVAEAREREVRHDVMSHVYAYGVQCPKAEPIIHLGATSCYVGDNTDVIVLRDASRLILKKAAQVVRQLGAFAKEWRDLPCLAYTHLQPAQLTTVGKRATLWIYELVQDMEALEDRLGKLLLLGSKGTTGTQASFMELFEGDEGKVKALEDMIAREMDCPFRGRPIRARWTPTSSPASPVSRSRHTSSRTTCVCSSPLKRSKSRSRKNRSVLPRCPTSATPCGVSASARWRAM